MPITTYKSHYNRETQTSTRGDIDSVTYVGCVIKVFCEDYRVMSDIYTVATFANVWNGEKTERVLVNSNFELDTSCAHAEVDATPEVLELVRKQEVARERLLAMQAEIKQQEREREEKNRPVKGKKMIVVKGRKVKPGTVGTVAYVHENGNALLKPDDLWQERKADGVWVPGRYLEAR